MSTLRRMGWLVGLVIVLAACSPSASPTDSGASTAPSENPSAAPSEAGPSEAAGLALRVVDTTAGPALAGENGLTLYIHTQEGTGNIVCTEGCLDNWPPLTGEVQAGDADAALLGTITRPDGIEQVTYNGYPLYYFIGDTAEGNAAGEGISGVWFIADPAGN